MGTQLMKNEGELDMPVAIMKQRAGAGPLCSLAHCPLPAHLQRYDNDHAQPVDTHSWFTDSDILFL